MPVAPHSTSNPDELAQLEREAAELLPPAEPNPLATAGQGEDDDLAAAAEQLLNDPAKLEQLEGLTADELGDVCQLGFGLVADKRGPHWELSDKSAARLGRYLERVIQKYGVGWLKTWLPEIMVAILLAIEVSKRLRQDRQLVAAAAVSS